MYKEHKVRKFFVNLVAKMSVLIRIPMFELHDISKIEPGIVIFQYNKELKYADMYIVVSKIKRDKGVNKRWKYFLSLYPYKTNCPQRCYVGDFGIRPYGRSNWNRTNRTYKVPLLKLREDKLKELVLEATKEWKCFAEDFKTLKPFREAFKTLQA